MAGRILALVFGIIFSMLGIVVIHRREICNYYHCGEISFGLALTVAVILWGGAIFFFIVSIFGKRLFND